jgi:hypothetical protein
MAVYTIEELSRLVIPVAREYGVKRVSLFGSYAKGSATSESDVDLLIEKGELRSLYQLCAFRLSVEDALNCSVDLVTTDAADLTFLDEIAKDEVLLYQAA